MTTHARVFAITSLALLAILGLSSARVEADPRFLLGDGSVRFVSVGPVRIPPGGSAESRLLLPAVHRGRVQVVFIGEDGQVLARTDVDPPHNPAGPLFPVVFHLTFTEAGQTRIPLLEITDGTSNTIFAGESHGIIAILIGLLLPAVQTPHIGSLQVFDAQGQSSLLLPYIEQKNPGSN